MHPSLMTALASTYQEDLARGQARRHLAAQAARRKSPSRLGRVVTGGTRRLIAQFRPALQPAACCA